MDKTTMVRVAGVMALTAAAAGISSTALAKKPEAVAEPAVVATSTFEAGPYNGYATEIKCSALNVGNAPVEVHCS